MIKEDVEYVYRLREQPLDELLTRKEYNLFLRFGIGPPEIPTRAEAAAFKKVLAKIETEHDRANAEFARFFRDAKKAMRERE